MGNSRLNECILGSMLFFGVFEVLRGYLLSLRGLPLLLPHWERYPISMIFNVFLEFMFFCELFYFGEFVPMGCCCAGFCSCRVSVGEWYPLVSWVLVTLATWLNGYVG